jgi:hypothetical protein
MSRLPDRDNPPPSDRPIIQASELAQYSFCHRAWWLGTVKNLPSRRQADLARGLRHHARHGYQVESAGRWRQLGLILLGSGVLMVVMVLIWLLVST